MLNYSDNLTEIVFTMSTAIGLTSTCITNSSKTSLLLANFELNTTCHAVMQDNEIPPLERVLEVVVSYDTHDITIDAISIDTRVHMDWKNRRAIIFNGLLAE